MLIPKYSAIFSLDQIVRHIERDGFGIGLRIVFVQERKHADSRLQYGRHVQLDGFQITGIGTESERHFGHSLADNNVLHGTPAVERRYTAVLQYVTAKEEVGAGKRNSTSERTLCQRDRRFAFFNLQFGDVVRTESNVQTDGFYRIRNRDTRQIRAISECAVANGGDGEFVVVVILVLGIETTRDDETSGITAVLFSKGILSLYSPFFGKCIIKGATFLGKGRFLNISATNYSVF